MRSVAGWLYRRAENIAALLLAVMFLAFLVQIAFRYFFSFPVGGASELTVVTWLWLVLFGAAFVVREREEIRFDILTNAFGRRARVGAALLVSVALIVLYSASLPASFDYVSFMKVEKSSYLKIRMDWLFSIYIVFLVAIVARYLWIVFELLKGREPSRPDVESMSSGL